MRFFRIGKSVREINRKVRHISPGPGQYELAVKYRAPHAIMAGRYNKKTEEETPGPASYDKDRSYHKLLGNIRYTIRDRLQEKSRNNQPGPGSYNTESNIKSRNGLKFGTSKRQLLAQTIFECLPGPGAYEYASLILRKNTPTYTYSAP